MEKPGAIAAKISTRRDLPGPLRAAEANLAAAPTTPLIDPNASQSSGRTEHRPELDGIRAVAITMVVVLSHLQYFRQGDWAPSVHVWLNRLMSFGGHGVELFFVLSGFLIGSILLRNREAPQLITTFYVRRAFRILPIYWLLLVLYVSAKTLNAQFRFGLDQDLSDPSPLGIWRYVFFFQNNVMAAIRSIQPLWLVVTWSLAVEEQFYLLAPWLVRVCSNRGLVFSSIVVILGAFAARYFFVEISGNPVAAMYLLVSKADGLGTGILIAVIARTPHVMENLRKNPWALRICLGLFCAFLLREIAWDSTARALTLVYPSLFVLGAGAVLLHLTIHPRSLAGRFLSTRPLTFIGSISYFVYLFHFPFETLGAAIARTYNSHYVFPAAVGGLCATILLAVLSRNLIERPLVEIGRRWSYDRREGVLRDHRLA